MKLNKQIIEMPFGKKARVVIYCLALSCLLHYISCANSKLPGVSNKESIKIQAREHWESLLEKYPPPSSSHELVQQYSFPDNNLERDYIYLYLPAYMSSNSKNNIFISDRGNHTVLVFDVNGTFLQKIGRKGQGAGEFTNPRFICTDNLDNLYVFDTGNSRIQKFNSTCEYVSSFKIFDTYSCMAVGAEDTIIVSPITNDSNRALIEILNNLGSKIDSFGERKSFKHNSPIHNEVCVSVNRRGEIFAAWRHFPFVRRYSKEGLLLSENKINFSLLEEISSGNYDAGLTDNKITMADVIMDIHAELDRYYIFVRYPRLLILESDFDGNILDIFWQNIQDYSDYENDFIILDEVDSNHKMTFISNAYPNLQITAFVLPQK